MRHFYQLSLPLICLNLERECTRVAGEWANRGVATCAIKSLLCKSVRSRCRVGQIQDSPLHYVTILIDVISITEHSLNFSFCVAQQRMIIFSQCKKEMCSLLSHQIAAAVGCHNVSLTLWRGLIRSDWQMGG